MKVLLFLVFATFSQAAVASSCTDLKQELLALQQAQQSMLQSMVANHETFSSTLEEFSEQLSESESGAAVSISSEMNQSAKAFRKRGLQAQKLNQKLDQATQDLLARVASCLK